MAKELERRGAHILAIKDMAGLLKPYAAKKLVETLKEDERSFISETNIREWFLKNAERYDNIRILKTKLENAVFEKLTDHFIIKIEGQE